MRALLKRRLMNPASLVRDRELDVEAFWRDGFTIVRNVYTPREISQFRRGVEASTGPKTDLLGNRRLCSVLTDGRLVDIARRILGSSEILYAGDSSFTVGNQQRGYHKDNADRLDGKAPDWNGRYSVLRFGVYLQDHRWHTGGLNLRVGSHQYADLTTGKNIYVRTGVGDVAVWSLRTSHSGNGDFLAFPWWKNPTPDPEPEFPRMSVKAPYNSVERMALFAALGLDDDHHDRYTEYLKTRQYITNMWKRTSYDDDVLGAATVAGLSVRNLPAEIAGDPNVGQNVQWKPLAY